MSDPIDRQSAINAVHECPAIHGSEGSWVNQQEVFDKIASLPTVQPEIIRCYQCGFWDRETLQHQFNDFRDWNEAECLILAERDVYHEINRYTEADDFCSYAERREE